MSSHHSKRSAIQDARLRRLCALVFREYRKTGNSAKNENLKHIRRILWGIRGWGENLKSVGCDPEILEVGILISDLAKEPHLIKKYSSQYGDSPFRAFLDHSRSSLREVNYLRKKVGIDNKTWRKILGAVIGHDGPSIPGSWWKHNYEKEIGHPYARIHTIECLIHTYFDRIDQGGIFRTLNGQLNGGLRKISYDLYQKEGPFKGNLPATVQEVFSNTRGGTYHQLTYLDHVLAPRFLKGSPLPKIIQVIKEKFEDAENYFQYVIIDKNRGNQVQISLPTGDQVVVYDLDHFWSELAKVTPKRGMVEMCRWRQRSSA